MRYRLVAEDGTAVGVEDGRLVDPDGPFDLSIDLGPVELRPGLINAHDHLHRNHYGRLGEPPYPSGYAWGRDIQERWADHIARGRSVDRTDALLVGALKNLLAGVTTVVHHDPWEPAFEKDFPIRLARVRSVHSLGFEPGFDGAVDGPPEAPLNLHVAEGTAPELADEVRALAARGVLDGRLVAVHLVGVDPEGVRMLRDVGVAVVWCPTSNAFLFGRTAPEALLAPGIDVLVGSDSLLTADGDLLDELRAARRLGLVDDERLLAGVGSVTARRLGLPAPQLTPGARADVAVFTRPVLEATSSDVALVVVGGEPRVGEERFGGLFERAGVPVKEVAAGDSPRLVHARLAQASARVRERAGEGADVGGHTEVASTLPSGTR